PHRGRKGSERRRRERSANESPGHAVRRHGASTRSVRRADLRGSRLGGAARRSDGGTGYLHRDRSARDELRVAGLREPLEAQTADQWRGVSRPERRRRPARPDQRPAGKKSGGGGGDE